MTTTATIVNHGPDRIEVTDGAGNKKVLGYPASAQFTLWDNAGISIREINQEEYLSKDEKVKE